jgi:hypothetical protein
MPSGLCLTVIVEVTPMALTELAAHKLKNTTDITLIIFHMVDFINTPPIFFG